MATIKTGLTYLGLAAIWGALIWMDQQWAAVGFLVVSTLAYVGFVGAALRAEETSNWFTRRWGAEGGFRRFRLPTSVIMNNYGVSLVVVAIVTRDSVSLGVDRWVYWGVGGALVVVGYGIKHWARRTIGRGYFWVDFFVPPEDVEHSAQGPYRWFSNPMYTIGYAHAYGVAIAFASLPALIGAVFMQLSILVFCWTIERSHYHRLHEDNPSLRQETTAS